MRIYLLPGLGADKRMYQAQLSLIPDAIVLEHLPPVKGQPLREYSLRVAALIDTTEKFVLIGTSLGGMVAIELANILWPEKVILIASVKNRDELPTFIRSMRYLRLHRLISGDSYKKFNELMIKRLNGGGDAQVAGVIRDMMNDVSPEFIEWAIDAVINWYPPAQSSTNIIHIHGSADQLFPIANIKNAIVVEKGSHVMNMTKSAEVNRLLLQALND